MLSGNAKDTNGPDRHIIDHWRVGLQIINPPLLHAPMGAQVVFVFDEPSICGPLTIEGPYLDDGLLTIYFSYPK